jgi:hypothetical protein
MWVTKNMLLFARSKEKAEEHSREVERTSPEMPGSNLELTLLQICSQAQDSFSASSPNL